MNHGKVPGISSEWLKKYEGPLKVMTILAALHQ
jgi:hypothetical protein